MKLVPCGGPDPVIADLVERLQRPRQEDEAHRGTFAKLRELVGNAEADIGPLTEEKRQLLGLYLLNARWLGEGADYEARPSLTPPGPTLTIVNHGGRGC